MCVAGMPIPGALTNCLRQRLRGETASNFQDTMFLRKCQPISKNRTNPSPGASNARPPKFFFAVSRIDPESGRESLQTLLRQRLHQALAHRPLFTRPSGPDADMDSNRRTVEIALAILVSTLLWFTFTMRETQTRTLELPVEVINVPEDQALSQYPPDRVRVQAVGEGWTLFRLGLRSPVIPMDASQSQVQVLDVVSEFLSEVQVQSVAPAMATLFKERRIARAVPVRAHATFETPATYDLLAPPAVFPDSVVVTGAVSVVSGLDEWPTVSQTFRGVRDTLNARLALVDTLAGLVQKNVEEVSLQAIAAEFTEDTRELVVTVQGQPSTRPLVSLEPSTVTVRFRVPLSQYQEAHRAMDFFATVSWDDIRRDTTGHVEPHLETPDGISLRDVEMIPRRLTYYQRID